METGNEPVTRRGRLTAQLRDAGRAFAVVRRSPSLARAEAAFGAAYGAEWAFTIGLGIVAFEDGGATRVGLVALLRLLPSALLAPVITAVADRWPRDHVLMSSSVVLAAATSAMAVALAAELPLTVVYVLAVLATVAMTPYRAAHSALLPSLCRTTDELTSSNIVRGMVESLSVVIGPLVAAALIDLTALWVVFAATAVVAGLGAAVLVRLPYERPPALATARRARLVGEVAEGFRAMAANREVALLTGLAATQTFTRGALSVFTVVLAIDVLDAGEPFVGVLQAAMGVGAVLGSLAAARLLGARRMAAWFGGAVALWGVPLCVIGAVPTEAAALGMLATIGVANAVLDVALFTMMGRLIPDEVLARVFGVFEAVVAVTVGVGAAAAAAAIDLLGVRPALMVIGALAPAAVVLGASRLSRTDELLAVRQRELDVLQGVPMLRTLPVATIEHLARHVTPKTLRPGDVVIRERTLGTRYYVIAAGAVEVRKRGELLRRMGPGEGFGEISLLRNVRRTTTVTATGDGPVLLYALDRRDFVLAVSGYAPAATAAATAINTWWPSAPR